MNNRFEISADLVDLAKENLRLSRQLRIRMAEAGIHVPVSPLIAMAEEAAGLTTLSRSIVNLNAPKP